VEFRDQTAALSLSLLLSTTFVIVKYIYASGENLFINHIN
jgi:hypothetical protein